jgi:hypothetical protein
MIVEGGVNGKEGEADSFQLSAISFEGRDSFSFPPIPQNESAAIEIEAAE